jgi:1,4-dihydroxy-2-naphthoate octaprenyltransferase
MNWIVFWLKNARCVALPQSLFPAVLAVCMAWKHADFSLLYAALAVSGVAFAHLGMNLFDDYFDYKNQKINACSTSAAGNTFLRAGKCHYLLSGKATEKQLLGVASLCLFLALTAGYFILLHRGITVLWIALAGGFLGIFYSAKPFCLGYRGFGELLIATVFGVLLTGGVFYASCGGYTASVGLISVAVGVLVANILFTHSVLDSRSDQQSGKKTLALLIRSTKGRFLLCCLLNVLPFLLIGVGICSRNISPAFGLTFLALPLAVYLIYLMWNYFYFPQKKFTPHFLMGFMEDWDRISRTGIDWFMIRWYLSRNLTMLFCLLAAIAALVG